MQPTAPPGVQPELLTDLHTTVSDLEAGMVDGDSLNHPIHDVVESHQEGEESFFYLRDEYANCLLPHAT
jgi:hypothetical protein